MPQINQRTVNSEETTRLSFLRRLSDRSDKLSWTEFHNRYGELLYRYARRCGASQEEAEDVVQEVEMYIFKAMDDFQYDASKGRFRAYLRSAVVHAMGRRVTKQSRREARLDPHTLDSLLEDEDREDDRWEHEWRLHCLRWAFRSVAREFEPVTLEAFRQHVLSNRPVQETAAHLGLSPASVYQAKCRILKRLKERIDSMGPHGEEALS